MESQEIFSIKIGGQAGQGIISSGQTLAKVASRSGYNTYIYTEFPSLIRGGHNVTQILVSKDEVIAPSKKTNLLIALNQDTLNKHASELVLGGGVIFDAEKKFDTSALKEEINLYPMPLSKLANEAGDQELLINTVAVGATVAILGGNLDILTGLLGEEFADKGKKVVNVNQKAAESGYGYASKNFADKLQKTLQAKENIEKKMIVSGSEAVALGAIAGGMQFAAIYPMSPVSNIMHTLATYQEKYGYIFKQTEDELAAINMAIGASFAGARSMTTTSGGGFCLMSEGYGLAAMTETPVVIVEGMRPGPATGLPTWSGQGDLEFALHAHQGDFPRIVLAAGDIKETFYLTMEALNLAEKYQTPVILLIDKNICESDQSYPVFDITNFQLSRGKLTTETLENYTRYAPSDDGISVRSIPGKGNFFIGNSDEHDERGFSTEEIEKIRQQQEKRMAKLKTCMQNDMQAPILLVLTKLM